jgi:predicted ATP-dependent endonuclease of OLD family
MAKIHQLEINNYRGIRNFIHTFDNDFVCLIGRGDSGKTTILEAINAVLTPQWNFNFNDTDFNNGNIESPIEIKATLYDLPTELLSESKYGLHKRLLNNKGVIIDNIENEDSEDNKDLITIKLIVTGDLEPKWFVTNNREQEDIEIRSRDRARLNVFLVSDYLDRHFSWSKGAPLYSLLKAEDSSTTTEELIVDANRKIRNNLIDSDSFNSLNGLLENIKLSAKLLGLSDTEVKAFLDFRNSPIKDGNIALYSSEIPYRLKGKGSKRLLSIAIQLELVKEGGIILIDEIEQGLEPDRVKHLVKILKERGNRQVIITTHSCNVIEELSYKDIFLKINSSENLVSFDESFQGCLRNNANAFFAKKIIVCEGATEVGICRSLDQHRINQLEKMNFSLLGIGLVDGTGANFVSYCQSFKSAGYDICAFCDSDDAAINIQKQELENLGIKIVDCDDPNSIEQQLINDLPWGSVNRLVLKAIEIKSEEHVFAVTAVSQVEDLLESDTPELRELLGNKAKSKGWFKRIDHGEYIGKEWFDCISEISATTLKTEFDNLNNWIDR